ncbi:MAG: nitroreductase family protein [Defluviitaleaceae bacterium]|nr:nitroreductase family protein [Defluviitaleaceae bacterium]
MTLLDAINIRHSRRKYDGTSIDKQDVDKLEGFIAKYNAMGNIRMQLITDSPSSFKGFTTSYGMFSGVNDYIALMAKKDDKTAVERVGYYGQLLILQATVLGLHTCWVGGAFKASLMPITIADDEMLVCVILIGNATGKESGMGKMIHKISHIKNKSLEQMYTSDRADESVPDWFMSGMRAVEKAPSSGNRKPAVFTYKEGRARASVKDISNKMFAIDLGIAKLHFEIGAACCQHCDTVINERWTWGNGGGYNNER